MRTSLIAALALVGTSLPAEAGTRNYTVTGFTKVRVEGPYKVTLTTGVPPFAKASGSPAALDRAAIEVRGDTLIVHTSTDAWGGYPGVDPGPVEISIGTHDLSDASLIGSGSISINRVAGLSFGLAVQGAGAAQIDEVAADQLSISLAGTTNAKLAGHTKRLTAFVRGLAALDASKLNSPEVHLLAQGSATIDAVAAQSAEVEASGPAAVRLAGRPSCELHVSGSATVSGCK